MSRKSLSKRIEEYRTSPLAELFSDAERVHAIRDDIPPDELLRMRRRIPGDDYDAIIAGKCILSLREAMAELAKSDLAAPAAKPRAAAARSAAPAPPGNTERQRRIIVAFIKTANAIAVGANEGKFASSMVDQVKTTAENLAQARGENPGGVDALVDGVRQAVINRDPKAVRRALDKLVDHFGLGPLDAPPPTSATTLRRAVHGFTRGVDVGLVGQIIR